MPLRDPAARCGAAGAARAGAHLAGWLAAKTTREKGSNASFEVGYLRQFPIAVVKRGQRPIAFANLWLSAGQEALSVDLMRHADDARNGALDFLFTELMLWGQRRHQ